MGEDTPLDEPLVNMWSRHSVEINPLLLTLYVDT